MAFDGIITKQVVLELDSVLASGKINKVFEPNKNEIILGIYSAGKNYTLDISIASNNYRVNLTTTSKPNPLNAPNFCMLLRKYLVGSRIRKVYSNSLERIIYIDLDCYNELNDLVSRTLVIELMGKHSNIILLNDKKIIIDSLRHLDTSEGSTRDILPTREYINPPADKIDFENNNDKELNISGKLSSYIPDTYNGFSKTFIINTLRELNISDENYSKEDISKLYKYISDVLSNLGTNNVTTISLDDKDYTIHLESNSDILQTNFFLDDYYKHKEDLEVLTNYKSNLSKLVLSSLKKITKKVNNINSKLKECDDMNTYRIYGELITSNLYRIDNSKNVSSIKLENYYDNNNIIEIPLDKTISPSYNAKKFFKKYNKLKNTLEIVSEQKKEATKELDYLESIVYELENASSISELEEIDNEISENVLFKNYTKAANVKKNKINKRNAHDEFEPITYNVDGFTLYVGKNNKQNDYITTKLGKNDDLWFHTKDIRGSHVLLKCNGSKVNDNTIVACAEIAAFYSKAKLSSNVPVDYCYIKNVKKPSGSKPGMVIYTNNQTINVNPKKI